MPRAISIVEISTKTSGIPTSVNSMVAFPRKYRRDPVILSRSLRMENLPKDLLASTPFA
jgi:hypothetical protein